MLPSKLDEDQTRDKQKCKVSFVLILLLSEQDITLEED